MPTAEWCYVTSNGASGAILYSCWCGIGGWLRRWRFVLGSLLLLALLEMLRMISFGRLLSIMNEFSLGRADPISWWDIPWFIGGDFNVSRVPIERSGAACLSLAMVEFSDFILEQGFMNLPFAGGTHTWSRNSSWSRLHCFEPWTPQLFMYVWVSDCVHFLFSFFV